MASALKNPGAIRVDWVAFQPGMLGDGRLRGLAFDIGASFSSVETTPRELDRETEQGEGKPTLMMLPYVAGVSERIRKACRSYNIRVVFRSGPTFWSMLTKVKDPLPVEKQANIVYEVPCSCGKVYIGETKRRLETRLKEHKEACVKGQTTKSAIAEHAWLEGHPINWDGTRILQRASHTMELVMKEAMCIQSTPTDSRFNRDSGYELHLHFSVFPQPTNMLNTIV